MCSQGKSRVLGTIPESWKILRVKRASLQNEQNILFHLRQNKWYCKVQYIGCQARQYFLAVETSHTYNKDGEDYVLEK